MTGRNPKFEWQDGFIRADLTPSEFKVGQAIANRWNGDNNQPFASADYLAENTGYSVRQVRRAIAGLREKGWIAQVQKGRRNGLVGRASRFRLTVPNLPNVTPVSSQRDMGVTPVDLTPIDLSPYARGVEVRVGIRKWCPHTYSRCEHACSEGQACITSLRNDGHTEWADQVLAQRNGSPE